MSEPTPNQQRAIMANGNVLVMAGAGTGKTSTLVERCLSRVCHEANPVPLDRILMVTFTEAAATEMRKRIREALEQRAAAQPQNEWLAEQLALVETARISTLHSFCLQLTREHFYELGLDPELTVLSAEQARLVARETLQALLQKHYAGDDALSEAVQQLIHEHGRGWDQPIRDLVLRVHEFTQTLSDPTVWFEKEFSALEQSQPRPWATWLREGFEDWRQVCAPMLEAQPGENTNARECARILRETPADPSREQIAAALAALLERDNEEHWPNQKKTAQRKPLEKLFDDAGFLHALARVEGETDPLAEDWNWVRPQMTALLRLAQEFSQEFAAAKRDRGAVDFHDLEQFALQLLRDRQAKRPTPIAQRWREKLHLVFVDEYQDINEAQDSILRALGREGAEANRFLVGDVKQSIYRFRLANPNIFQRYAESWKDNQAEVLEATINPPLTPPGKGTGPARQRSGAGPEESGQVVPLTDNFRSHESILNFVNRLFIGLMRREVGGVAYEDSARLSFGAPNERAALSAAADPRPRAELHLHLTGNEPENGNDEEALDADDLADLTNTEMEARLVALRLRQLREEQHPVWKQGKLEPVDWRDMVILLRSPRNKAESYAKVFESLGVPLVVARGGFYESQEIIDLLSLLTLLDNPLQDAPLLAVLRSPLVALARFHREVSKFKSQLPHAEIIARAESAWPKVDAFSKSFAAWRQIARQGSLSQCLEAALDETCYEAWLLTQRRSEQRCANVRRLLALTRQFDEFQRQGLFRFLKFVEAQRDAEAETEPALAQTENAVQLMSIHQSKGLEFPMVALADLGKRFNFDDLKSGVILDEHYGLCPLVKPPHTGQRYASLPYWLAKRRQRLEALGEELRLLYVAMTRARDRLILAGTASRKKVLENWPAEAAAHWPAHQIAAANSYLDWLGRWLPSATGHSDWTTSGQTALLAWTVYDKSETRCVGQVPIQPSPADLAERPTANPSPGGELARADASHSEEQAKLAALRRRLGWRYPFIAATTEPAKTSVSALRRRLRDEADDEARPLFPTLRLQPRVRLHSRESGNQLSAAEIGTAHHLLLQRVRLDRVASLRDLKSDAERLRQARVLSDEAMAALDFEALLAFWQSELGRRIRAQPARDVHRELPFTARMSPSDFLMLRLPVNEGLPDDEFVVVQGVVDLAVILPKEIWLVDFKTDHLREGELEEKTDFYRPQVKLYGLALSRIYRRNVTESWLHFLSPAQTRPVR
ncbi:MAG: hypothetical protein DME22_01685 [Verrucomicrobia bacterium]|nr:MAG: hypothetical protein DME22_01685 [Verrucomicrobiota bacterium]